MKPVVFIHTNDSQLLGGKCAEWSFKAASKRPDAFEVRYLRVEETPALLAREGHEFKRKGKVATWHNRDLQSFTPLRFAPPQAMGFTGRALVIDPDVFALCDVMELFERDMGGKALLCKWCESYLGSKPFWATSVMLLDCAKLTHWRFDAEIEALFAGRFDYGDWISLRREAPETIGRLEEEWNDFDRLTPATKLIHMTERSTQPWKTGLPVDFDTMYHGKDGKRPPPQLVDAAVRARREAQMRAGTPRKPGFLERVARKLGIAAPRAGGAADGAAVAAASAPALSAAAAAATAAGGEGTARYLQNPDPEQEKFFFTLLRGALAAGLVTPEDLAENVRRDFVRHDAPRLLAELPPFDYAGFLAGRWQRPARAAAAGGGNG
ncbi:MAG: hypothetical protein JNL90_11575 [Planctomycetes bacterium]|nr:hypothetical protein [Planctomycetota bacterium]